MAAPGQRIVMLALDGGAGAREVLEWYFNNLKQENDYVYGVTVVEYDVGSIATTGGGDSLQICQHFKDKYAENEKLTADYAAELRTHKVKGQCDSVNGNKPGEILCQQADTLKANIIVMGTRGLGKIKRAILGSVSSYVLHTAGIPVVVIPTASG